MKYSICNDWEFTEQWSKDFLFFNTPAQSVRLPHTCKEIPLHYADSNSYQMICGYRRILHLPEKIELQRNAPQGNETVH